MTEPAALWCEGGRLCGMRERGIAKASYYTYYNVCVLKTKLTFVL